MSVDIEKLRALCEKATPGPWSKMIFDVCADNVERVVAKTDGEHSPLAYNECQANAAFIAAARTALPELLDEVERLRVLADAARAWSEVTSSLKSSPNDIGEACFQLRKAISAISSSVQP